MKTRKPLKANLETTRAWQDRSRKPLTRTAFWQTKKGTGLRRVAMKQRNEARIARRAKAYAKRLRSTDWKELRYAAYLRSGGFCECAPCVRWRQECPPLLAAELWQARNEALTPVDVWFVKSGKSPATRFRGGSVHHLTYRRFGEERLEDIQFMHKTHHAAIEASHGTRLRYLRSGK